MGKLISLDNLARFRENMEASVWESIAAAADGTTITFDAEQRKLSASGGGSSASEILAYAGAGELEDLTIRTGSFANAGEGWNTFTFPEPFEGVPHAIVTVESGYSVEVKGVTETEFLYKVTAGSAASVTTGTYYVHTSKTTSSSSLTAVNLVTGVGSGGSTGTSDAVTVRYTAIEFGGE